ncbi:MULTISPECIES: Grx4 family monothiol glutaredoxin [Lysobacter]|jgi:monothiol glutaredoxin|uniref:Grx4 family monothiol glutaredoxin n=1 Tax=Lysobacter gummosus TaxID=262324 RepID=A0ABY3XDS8_9GAMM|nr:MULTISPECIES: Grx4 family monothiol glutaredoxin [Lysobacter]ALN89558.1 monothiol glutaredoxin, Grx4 family [Lysobacter gummosus]UJB18527.1 Grx4 family monothiol glutaredoxin [Lysobacter capsici]UJQ27748.1 Grx4 family monothiol glutaredoxin [Lysobacter gummosus]UNP30195.1 Grx4 family monothiol glutaredoxin [Lysobacter gummosus]
MSLDPALRSRIETLLQSNRVVLFMKGDPTAPQCGFSAKASGALNALLPQGYAHVDVLADPDIREGIKAYGEWPTIPQLYIDAQLVGGSDIIEQMAASGELHSALGLPAPDRSPPKLSITPAAAQMLRDAVANAGADYAVQLEVDARHNVRLQLAPIDANAVAVEVEGVRVQTDWINARRADGVSIDWADDERGRGLVITNPNAPPAVRAIVPADARERVRAGSLRLVDVRPPDERAIAQVELAFDTFDHGTSALETLPKDTPLAFLCHHGGRSAQAAEHFRQLGYREVYNVEGGIDAWADLDGAIAKY